MRPEHDNDTDSFSLTSLPEEGLFKGRIDKQPLSLVSLRT